MWSRPEVGERRQRADKSFVAHTGGDPVRQPRCVCAARVREPGEPEAALHAHHRGDERAGRRRTGARRSGCAAGGSGHVPAHCDVRGVIRPSRDSNIKFALWLPAASAWNAKYRQEGNGGWAGAINTASFAEPLRRGYAVAGTDNGHEGGGGADWAIGHPEKLIDFGYRAVHETAVQSKAIIRAFYGRDPERSYFNGCSDGGREALMEAQRFPEDFNGILAGAPANNWSRLFTAFVWNERALLATPDSAIPPAKLPVIQRAVMAACDRLDGVADGLIENPRACRFDPAVLVCKERTRPIVCPKPRSMRCRRSTRDRAIRAPRNASSSDSRPGRKRCRAAGAPGSRRRTRQAPSSSRSATATTGRRCSRTPSGISGCSTSIATCASAMRRRDRSSTRPALTCGRSVRRAGSSFSTTVGRRRHSRAEFDRVRDGARLLSKYPDARTPGAPPTEDFYRLFLVPGMAHCGGGSGANSFGNGGGSGDPPGS